MLSIEKAGKSENNSKSFMEEAEKGGRRNEALKSKRKDAKEEKETIGAVPMQTCG